MRFIRAINYGAERICIRLTDWTGSTLVLMLSVMLIIGWLCTGPMFGYSDTWQLVANTFTTLVEFIMVFVLQRAQNKDTADLHRKLDDIQSRLDVQRRDSVESNE